MAESQNIEYKESWQDKYLKWICGFANAQGGTIYIGIDDNGNVVGTKNVDKLMEDIPNKIQSGLGIIADVNRKSKDGLDYIEIKVEPSAYPVSFHGEYHYRSGSTKQLMTGIALSEFIMRKTGFRWEDVTVDDITVDDLDEESFKIFRREALRSKRMTKEELNIPNKELLQKLHLISKGKLKRSAVLLFYQDPSVIQNGSFLQIGKFGKGSDLQYHDPIEESLICIADKAINIIYQKYLKAKISYVNDKRVETYPFARDAVREAVFNAIAHNCYMFGSPIQVRIEDETMTITNQCILPEGWTVDTLMASHESKPYNPDIANVFYRAGYIERWGRGIEKICEACKEIGADLPKYQLIGTGLHVRMKALQSALIDSTIKENGKTIRENEKTTGEIEKSTEETPKTTEEIKKSTEETSKSTEENEKTTRERILQLIRENADLTQKEMAKRLEMSEGGIKYQIDTMKKCGILRREGSTKKGKWIIIR